MVSLGSLAFRLFDRDNITKQNGWKIHKDGDSPCSCTCNSVNVGNGSKNAERRGAQVRATNIPGLSRWASSRFWHGLLYSWVWAWTTRLWATRWRGVTGFRVDPWSSWCWRRHAWCYSAVRSSISDNISSRSSTSFKVFFIYLLSTGSV